MHPEAFGFVERAARYLKAPTRVLEVGSRNVNGTARDAFEPDTPWLGVDLLPGPGVDVVSDFHATDIEGPFDLVVCCEVLEHERNVPGMVDRMVDLLRPEGHLLVTCATDGRAPHGVDGGHVAGEWYRNVSPWELVRENLDPIIHEVHAHSGDLYLLGQKVA